MCGIFGIINKKAEFSDSVSDKILETLNKRGPDNKGVYCDNTVFLGHTRLSIIDIEGGSQPMTDIESGLTIVFNGEIYNYKTIRDELIEKGHTFHTSSDTEVILKSYLEYGEDCVDHLDGMFAFVIWDANTKTAFMARDRFGEKPLYYSVVDGTLYFASEIKALLQTGVVEPIIDTISIDNYLTLLYVPPWRTIYKTITPLQPAHRAIFRDGTISTTRYWSIKNKPVTDSDEVIKQKIKNLIEMSVQSRMVSDVEVGSFLSGGIDSGIVTSLASKTSTHKLKSFSAGFDNAINELPQAQLTAQFCKTDHFEKNINFDITTSLRETIAYFDEPFADSSNIPTHLISQFAREHVKVALSGDGGDELFYGYGHYRSFTHRRKIEKLLHPFITHFDYYKQQLCYFSTKERKSLWRDSDTLDKNIFSHIDISEAQTDLEEINLFDYYLGLPGDMLTKVDRASMMNSLEIRSPFLNHKLAEYAFNIPAKFKTTDNKGKIILKEIFEDILPAGIFDKKKQGFGAPVIDWLQKPEIQKLIDTTFVPGAHIYSLFNEKAVHKTLSLFKKRPTLKNAYKVWQLLTLELWFASREKYILK